MMVGNSVVFSFAHIEYDYYESNYCCCLHTSGGNSLQCGADPIAMFEAFCHMNSWQIGIRERRKKTAAETLAIKWMVGDGFTVA
jgi:hypothetical protein